MTDILKRLRTIPSSFNDACRTMDDAADHIEALEAALQSLTKDPPSSLAREPDEDWEVIVKMRAIARAALDKDNSK